MLIKILLKKLESTKREHETEIGTGVSSETPQAFVHLLHVGLTPRLRLKKAQFNLK